MADKDSNHQMKENSEIFELKLINSLLLQEFRKFNYEISANSDSNNETIEITQLKLNFGERNRRVQN